ncbi:Uncharacterised protein [Streptococcus pneumoniae]|nr:Uncharacterised protein [Streptococcus pneumoniae]
MTLVYLHVEMLDIVQFLIREINSACIRHNLFLVKLGRGTHVDQLVVTRCVVSDFFYKVNLRII